MSVPATTDLQDLLLAQALTLGGILRSLEKEHHDQAEKEAPPVAG